MSTLADRIRTELTESMKARNAEKTSTLRMIQAALKNEQIEKGHELSDEETEVILRRAVKQRLDSIDQYRKGGREELAAKEESELTIIQIYLPQMMSDGETEAVVDEAIASTGASSRGDTGKVMKAIMASHKGRVDGKKVQEILSRRLG